MADLNINSNAPATTQDFQRLIKVLEGSQKQAVLNVKAFNDLSKVMNGLRQASSGLLGFAGINLTFQNLAQSTAKYNKSLYDLSKSVKFTGQSFQDLKNGMDLINKTTNLSMQDSAQFVQMLNKQTIGIKMTGAEAAKLAQTLSNEFGNSLQDVAEATSELTALQNQGINVFGKMNKEMSGPELQKYLNDLRFVYGASEKQVEVVQRTLGAYNSLGAAETEEQKRLKELHNSSAALKKAGEDLLLTWGQPLADAFTTVSNTVSGVLGGIKEFSAAWPNLTKVVAAGAATLGVAAAGFTALQGAAMVKNVFTGGGKGGVPGKGGGVVGTLMGAAGLGGGRDGSSAAKALFVQMSRGGPAGALADLAGEGPLRGTTGRSRLGRLSSRLSVSAQRLSRRVPGGRLLGRIAGGTGRLAGGAGKLVSGGAGKLVGGAAGLIGGAGALGGVAKLAAPVALAGSAYGAATTLFSQKARDENSAGRGSESWGDTAGKALKNVLDPVQAGKDIGTAASLTWNALADLVTGPETNFLGKGASKEAQATAALSNKEYAKQASGRQEALDRANAEAKTNEEISKQSNALASVRMQMEQINKLTQKNVSNLQLQGDYLLKYKDDVAGAEAAQEKIVAELQDQVDAQQQLVDLAKKMRLDVEAGKQLTEATKEEAKKRGMTEVEITSAYQDRKAAIAFELELAGTLAEKTMKVKEAQGALTDILEQRKSVNQEQLALAESELQLSQALYMGLGPTIDSQMKIVDIMEAQIGLIDQQIAKEEKRLAIDSENTEAKKKLLKLQQQKNQAVSKELEVTKNLREGYLDAMGAFTNVEGAFAKIILKRESGMGEIIRQFKAQGGFKTGAGGAGANAPMARYGPDGQLQYDQAEMNKQSERYGGLGPVMRNRINEAASQKASGTESFFAAKAMAGGGGGSDALFEQSMQKAAEIQKQMGGQAAGIQSGSPAAVAAGADPIVAAISKLNTDTPENVSKGILMSQGKAPPANSPAAAVAKTAADQAAATAAVAKGVEQSNALASGPEGMARRQTGEGESLADVARGKQKEFTLGDFQQTLAKVQTKMAEVGKKLKGDEGNVGLQNEHAALAIQEKQLKNTVVSREKEETLKKQSRDFQKQLAQNKIGGRNVTDLPGVGKAKDDQAVRVMQNLQKSMTDQTKAIDTNTKGLDKSTTSIAAATAGPEVFDDSASVEEAVEEIATGSKGGFMRRFASGGFVPGSGSKDSIPALLMPGEFVMNKKSSERYAWLLNSLNNNKFGMGGFAGGGPVAPSPSAGGGGGFSPRFAINIKGESVNKLTRMATTQISSQLNRMMTPSGSSGRFFDGTL